ncbi:hypothetical protein CALVIDRAFT_397488 [Calocera viscosa TUFC12733]|uniref:Uncharacterized protein n=1 Tax=Calocera viscosa (strain TUFC12733) TaxID=1330018 RepID=A0A167PQW1_CALVF|nr:hypothetical protein CALVIDRAFT_397488 [Calocera viscosa TUFC12733]
MSPVQDLPFPSSHQPHHPSRLSFSLPPSLSSVPSLARFRPNSLLRLDVGDYTGLLGGGLGGEANGGPRLPATRIACWFAGKCYAARQRGFAPHSPHLGAAMHWEGE